MAKLLNEPFSGLASWRATGSNGGRWENEALKTMFDKHDLNGESCVGYIARFEVGKKNAYYLVVDDEPLTLQHIPLSNGCEAPAAMINALIIADVQKARAIDRKWKEEHDQV